MPGELIEINQSCSQCGNIVGTVSEKKENMMLSTQDELWCNNCGQDVLTKRDVVGRVDSINAEVDSYPTSVLPLNE
tara:strand:- start:11280 stop:11507 length:228 start_codon:yes stop_codon:yes gene_type:complete